MEAIHLHHNMSCAEIAVSTHKTITGREMEEIEAGEQKAIETRQEDRNGRLAALQVRYGEDGDARKFLRGVDRNYM